MERDKRRQIFEPSSSMEGLKNISIASDIKTILDIKPYERSKDITYIEKGNQNNLIQIASYSDKKAKEFDDDTGSLVPRKFSFPIYIFNAFTYSNDGRPIYTTQYGMMPESIVCGDNCQYNINNIYILNDICEAIKQETIVRGDPLETPSPEILRVNFTFPEEYSSRFVRLSDRDYVKMNAGLRLIKNGTYLPC